MTVKEGGKKGPEGDGTDVGMEWPFYLQNGFSKRKNTRLFASARKKKRHEEPGIFHQERVKKEKNKMPGFGLV